MTQMPTAAKLFGAAGFAAVGFVAAEAFKPLMPPDTQWGWFSVVCAVFGAFWGWRIAGRRAGRGYGAAMSSGLTTAAVLTVTALFAFSVREMLLRSLNRRYSGPMEATVGTFDIMLEYGRLLGDLRVLGVLVVGGLLAGLAAEVAGRNWR